MWMHSGEWLSGPIPWIWYALGHTLWWSLMIVGVVGLMTWQLWPYIKPQFMALLGQ